MPHHHRVAVHRSSDHGMVHDSLPRHFRLFGRLWLVHHRLRGVVRHNVLRFLCNHRLLLEALWLLAALLLLLLLLLLLAVFMAVVALLVAALLVVLLAGVAGLLLRLVADLRRRVHHRVGTRLLLEVVPVVSAHRVHAQSVPSLASLLAVRTLVDEAGDVRLDVLLHSGPDLRGEVALGALPRGFADGGVVVGDHQLRHLPVQLQVHLGRHLADHLSSLLPWTILLLLCLLWLELHPSSSTTSSHWSLGTLRAVAWTRIVALVATTAHPLWSLAAVHFWLVLLDHVSSQGVSRLQDLIALSALVDNTGNVGLDVLLHLGARG